MKIVLFGSGNVAWNLSQVFFNKGHEIVQIIGRTINNTEKLANKFNCDYTTDYNLVKDSANLYILAVNDNSIEQIVDNVDFKTNLVAHTSGSISINVFSEKVINYGVFYPLQTFSKNRKAEFNNIPMCIEANSENNLKTLINLANQISNSVYQIDSTQRQILHLSAVFASNFVNHMYTISAKLLNDNNLNFDILLPLIKETYQKAIDASPYECQTGPAIRNDKNIIDKHIKQLNNNPDLQTIYKIISKHILQIRKN